MGQPAISRAGGQMDGGNGREAAARGEALPPDMLSGRGGGCCGRVCAARGCAREKAARLRQCSAVQCSAGRGAGAELPRGCRAGPSGGLGRLSESAEQPPSLGEGGHGRGHRAQTLPPAGRLLGHQVRDGVLHAAEDAAVEREVQRREHQQQAAEDLEVAQRVDEE
ncbi:hypothetical protein DAKH74_029060 [Maudiozyma humilis]|uniref:Uncharacterized protein n=1 Tax=Maudiozyma humilis TaxID=51915 RepID=A0AAV5RXF0_MAUHU|nr:hypothetical protein DAKH74_029060 [Kazachstania humilis]